GGGGGRGGGGMGGRGGSNSLYSVTIAASARNLLNNVNLAQPVGNLSTSRFGESVAIRGGFGGGASGNRLIQLQMRVSF
ncbi:MAG: hypothetical protein AB7O65_12670, partial [Candidatus Korobacteraceae bacterium]